MKLRWNKEARRIEWYEDGSPALIADALSDNDRLRVCMQLAAEKEAALRAKVAELEHIIEEAQCRCVRITGGPDREDDCFKYKAGGGV